MATVAALVAFAASASGASDRVAATCYPSAWTSFLGGGTAQGVGVAQCDANACWTHDTRLVTSGGVVLSEWNYTYNYCWPYSGDHSYPTGIPNCRGLYVHTFFYINVSGTGKSFTTGNKPC